jgi:hypothetical protein
MKEIRVAVQAPTNLQLIKGLENIIRKLKEDESPSPVYSSNGLYKLRMMIIEDAEIKSDSFTKELPG